MADGDLVYQPKNNDWWNPFDNDDPEGWYQENEEGELVPITDADALAELAPYSGARGSGESNELLDAASGEWVSALDVLGEDVPTEEVYAGPVQPQEEGVYRAQPMRPVYAVEDVYEVLKDKNGDPLVNNQGVPIRQKTGEKRRVVIGEEPDPSYVYSREAGGYVHKSIADEIATQRTRAQKIEDEDRADARTVAKEDRTQASGEFFEGPDGGLYIKQPTGTISKVQQQAPKSYASLDAALLDLMMTGRQDEAVALNNMWSALEANRPPTAKERFELQVAFRNAPGDLVVLNDVLRDYTRTLPFGIPYDADLLADAEAVFGPEVTAAMAAMRGQTLEREAAVQDYEGYYGAARKAGLDDAQARARASQAVGTAPSTSQVRAFPTSPSVDAFAASQQARDAEALSDQNPTGIEPRTPAFAATTRTPAPSQAFPTTATAQAFPATFGDQLGGISSQQEAANAESASFKQAAEGLANGTLLPRDAYAMLQQYGPTRAAEMSGYYPGDYGEQVDAFSAKAFPTRAKATPQGTAFPTSLTDLLQRGKAPGEPRSISSILGQRDITEEDWNNLAFTERDILVKSRVAKGFPTELVEEDLKRGFERTRPGTGGGYKPMRRTVYAR